MKKMALVCSAWLLTLTCFSQDTLYNNFQKPPSSARPRVWWHWMNGNITKDGIRKDLEWMSRSGIGGFQNFDASLGTPQIVEKRLTYMTPEWQDAFLFTTKLADSLKLEMAIAGSPGWSESGGPWVKPEDGMKKLVWTELRVNGGASGIKLPPSSGEVGPFQNYSTIAGIGEDAAPARPPYYKDVAVVAFKLPEADKSLASLGAVVSSSGGSFTLQQLTDGDIQHSNLLPRDSVKGYAWIQFAFPKPETIKSITMVGAGFVGTFGFGADAPDGRKLEVSDDGLNYKFVTIIPVGNVIEQTINIAPTTARYFRITVKNPPPQGDILAALTGGNAAAPRVPPGTNIYEIVLHTVSRVHMFEEKDAFSPAVGLYKKATENTPDIVASTEVIDLTSKMDADGTIHWTPPAGEWKILRFGYSLMGINNHPASPEATGLEVDKLDPAAIKRYFTNYLDQYKKATGGLMGSRGLGFMVTDSWEAGAQNWTGNMMAEFQKRRGYNMLPWMPVLAGHIVKSAEASEQFLFDFRKTLADMVAEYHYDGLTEILKAYGMKRYSESHEDGRAMIADGMEVKRSAAIPMSALWTPSPFLNQNNQHKYTMDIRESAAVAHIYGQNIVAAESLTAFGIGGGAWSYTPENLKSSADLELANGLNRFVIHTSVHQPVDDKIPGLGLGPFGQWFNRHESWAGQAKAWTDYLSRSSYMLQQGKFIADIVYYYGEDNNITALFREKPPVIPQGYNYDFINADALINKLAVKDGKLITATGMSYTVLVLDSNATRMSLPVLRKIQELVKAGARIAGAKPVSTPSLADDQQQFKAIVDEVWGSDKVKQFEGKALEQVMQDLKVPVDFSYSKPQANTQLFFVHRKLADRELYWVNNRNNRPEKLTASFRVSGKVPKLWHPEDARIEEVSYNIENGVTSVELSLAPNDAVFVIFDGKATSSSKTVKPVSEQTLATVGGEWKVKFQKDRGAPDMITMDKLASLSKNENAGVKYFSGTASYSNTINADKSWFVAGQKLILDLGDVKDLAEVVVNGKSLGVIWKTPFRSDITKALKPGNNTIEIRVTNVWVNRLIGDAQPGAKKITYTTMPFYQANGTLLPSGLMGPVRVIR